MLLFSEDLKLAKSLKSLPLKTVFVHCVPDKVLFTLKGEKHGMISGLYYIHITIVNDASRVVSE
jgi:hypothetical protein